MSGAPRTLKGWEKLEFQYGLASVTVRALGTGGPRFEFHLRGLTMHVILHVQLKYLIISRRKQEKEMITAPHTEDNKQ